MSDEYSTATGLLERAVYMIAHGGLYQEMAMAMYWPSAISGSILADIQSLRPRALILLAYFSVVLRLFERQFWFLRGWSRRLCIMAQESINSDHEPILEMLQWPCKQVLGRSYPCEETDGSEGFGVRLCVRGGQTGQLS